MKATKVHFVARLLTTLSRNRDFLKSLMYLVAQRLFFAISPKPYYYLAKVGKVFILRKKR
jgi:hypothetical protein